MSNEEFLRTLFPDLFGGFIEIRAIGLSGPANSLFYPSIEVLIADKAVIAGLAKDHNIYFGVCPRSTKQGNKDAVKHIWSLWVDLDAKDFAGGKDEILFQLNSFPISPSIVVESGNGFHAYWILKESFEITGQTDVVKIESYLKSLATALHGDSAAAELARILRLPGTFNYKNAEAPKEVKMGQFNSAQQCNLHDFDFILPRQPETKESKSNPSGWISQTLAGLHDGNRNAAIAKITGRLIHGGLGQDDIIALLEPFARKSAFPIDEFEREVRGICQRYPRNPFPIAYDNKEEMEIKPIEAIPLVDFLAESNDQIEWVVKDIIPDEGVAILAGPPGYGKSWMMLDLAIEAARGGEWLEEFQTRKMKVLYIDEESSPALLKRRLKKLLNGKGIKNWAVDIRCVVGGGVCLTDSASSTGLYEAIKAFQPGLIIVDSLIRVHRAEENSAKEMSQVFGVVKDIVRKFKCAFLFSDHQRKPNQFGGTGELLLRGTTEKVAFVDTLLSLSRKDGQLIVDHSKSRYAEAVPSFIISVEDPAPDTTKVVYTGNISGHNHRLYSAKEFLKSHLEHGQWVSRFDLVKQAESIQISEKKVDRALREIHSQGLIERKDEKVNPGRGGLQALYRWKTINSSPLPTAEMETETGSQVEMVNL